MDFCYYSHSVSASPSLFLHSLFSSLLSCLICSLDFVLSSCLLSSHFSLPPSPSHSLLLFDNETLNFLPAALSLLGTPTHTTRIRRVRQSNCLWQRALRVLITPLPLCVLCETSISIFILDYLLAGLYALDVNVAMARAEAQAAAEAAPAPVSIPFLMPILLLRALAFFAAPNFCTGKRKHFIKKLLFYLPRDRENK